MTISHGLRPYLSSLTSLVGAGGKTSTMFALARECRAQGKTVLVTATTHLADHRLDLAQPYDTLLLRPDLACGRFSSAQETGNLVPSLSHAKGLLLLVSGEGTDSGDGRRRLQGLDPRCIPGLRAGFDIVFVEADGSRGLSLKVPGVGEPVLPPGVGTVLGLIGLDCLGVRVQAGIVHRPEGFAALGIGLGSVIGPTELAIVVSHPLGLFKDAPPGAIRLVLLNKADLVGEAQARDLAILLAGQPGVDAVGIWGRGSGQASLMEGAVVYSRLPKESTP